MLRLASSSPRRIELLRLLQVPFESTAPGLDEGRVRHQAAHVAVSLEFSEIAAEVKALFKKRPGFRQGDRSPDGTRDFKECVAYPRARRCRSGSKC